MSELTVDRLRRAMGDHYGALDIDRRRYHCGPDCQADIVSKYEREGDRLVEAWEASFDHSQAMDLLRRLVTEGRSARDTKDFFGNESLVIAAFDRRTWKEAIAFVDESAT
jgi:hypothetical protein